MIGKKKLYGREESEGQNLQLKVHLLSTATFNESGRRNYLIPKILPH